TVEEINIARMDPEAVVDHREMTYSVAVEPIDDLHHVCGIQRMNEVSDDAIGLLSQVDLPCVIHFIDNEGAIRCGDALCFRFPGFMNNRKTRRCSPRHASIRFRRALLPPSIALLHREDSHECFHCVDFAVVDLERLPHRELV